MARQKSLISQKEQNEIISNMQQNKYMRLNAGQKREQVKSILDALSKCSRTTRASVVKKLIDIV